MIHRPTAPIPLDLLYAKCSTLWLTKVKAAVFGFVHFVKSCARTSRCSRDGVGDAAAAATTAATTAMIVNNDFMILLQERRENGG